MALVLKDRVKQTTTTTGTGNIVLNGNIDGFQTFAAALTDGDTTYFGIFVPSTNDYEVGLGTWTEGSATLARTTILESSNSGSAINITAQAEVFITQPAEKAVFQNANGDVDLGGNKILFGNLYSTTGDLPSASTYHGMFAHVHGTGKAYYAHGGNWIELVNEDTSGNVSMGGNLTVTGDLTVNGTTTTVSTTNTVVKDSLIELGNGTSGSPSNDAGIVIERGSSDNAFIGYDESADKFTVGTGSFTGATTGNLTISTGTLVANVEGSVTGNVTGNVSGSSGSTTGNAATATALASARNIGGVSFDGTANIDLAGVNSAGNQNTSGNAATATALASARNIGGVSFDGTGNIDLAGVNTSGNQDTSGNAATATALATARDIALTGAVTGSTSFDGSGNVSIATTATSDPTITLTGSVTGSGTMTNLGNVSIATTATADPTLTLSGDASGSATFTNLGNATLAVTVANDSHTHDTRYYQEGGTVFSGTYPLLARTSARTAYSNTGIQFTGSSNTLAVTGDVTVAGNSVWHTGNDGSGSGLDADTVDGIQASSFLRSDTADSTSSTISFTGDIEVGDQIFHDGDTDTYMQFHAADSWRVVTGGTERLEATNSGIRIDDAYTLPTADGTNGQVLSTNGSGAISFIDAGGGGYEVVSDTTVSNNSNVVLTIEDDVPFIIELINVRVGTNGSALNMYYTTGGTNGTRANVTSSRAEKQHNTATFSNQNQQESTTPAFTYFNAPGNSYPNGSVGGVYARFSYFQPSGDKFQAYGHYVFGNAAQENRYGIYQAIGGTGGSNSNSHSEITSLWFNGNGSPGLYGRFRVLKF